MSKMGKEVNYIDLHSVEVENQLLLYVFLYNGTHIERKTGRAGNERA